MKYRSKGGTTLGGREVNDGAIVEAHLVSAAEGSLQVPAGPSGAGGIEWLNVGDALVTLPDNSQHVVRAAEFAALFEPAAKKPAAKEPAAKEPAAKEPAAKEPAKKG